MVTSVVSGCPAPIFPKSSDDGAFAFRISLFQPSETLIPDYDFVPFSVLLRGYRLPAFSILFSSPRDTMQ